MSLYGAGPRKMSAEIGMPESEAKEFYKSFHAGLPQIKMLSNPPPRNWHPAYTPGAIERQVGRRGYITTLHGRHIHVPEYGEHKMLNRLIQGSAADLMKASLLRVHRWQRESGVESRMVSVIHDEIIFDGPESEIDVLHEHVPPLMREDRITEVIPLDVDHEVSVASWADKVEYDEWRSS